MLQGEFNQLTARSAPLFGWVDEKAADEAVDQANEADRAPFSTGDPCLGVREIFAFYQALLLNKSLFADERMGDYRDGKPDVRQFFGV